MTDGNDMRDLLNVENLIMHFPIKSSGFNKTPQFVKAVEGISFSIHDGKTFGLVGESGCGKTTVGKCITRINEPTAGNIYFKGTDIATLTEREFKPYRRKIQLIFQDPYGSLDPRQTVFSIVKEALVQDKVKRTKDDIVSEVEEYLLMVGLDPSLGGRYPHEMSGGQRQRLSIARALACKPELIVCDEPVSALDVSIQAQIINLFIDLQEKLGLTYLFIAHDLAVVRHIAEKIGVMYLGKIVELMDAEDLYKNSMHPYTKALLSAVPITDYIEERQRERIILGGEVPSPVNTPSGCPFHPRCSYVTDKCKEQMPELEDIGAGHKIACINYKSVT